MERGSKVVRSGKGIEFMKTELRLSKCAFTLALVMLSWTLAHGLMASSSGSAQGSTALAGTTWSGTDSDGDAYTLTFEHDGTLAYTSPTGSFTNGKWNQFKTAVYFETNDHVSEYLGTISGNQMEGKAWNKSHRSWTWSFTRHK
jgi:hypothetical protein